MKNPPENGNTGRRAFLKGTAAAAGAAIAATTQLAQAAEAAAEKPAGKAAGEKKLPLTEKVSGTFFSFPTP